MDEMTLISMNIYHIDVNHFKYEIIWQNMQKKISNICLRFGTEYPSLRDPPMASLVTAQWAGPLRTDIPVRTATYDRYY
jgi:hypothetical protein